MNFDDLLFSNDKGDKSEKKASKITVNVKGVNVTGKTSDFVDAVKFGASVAAKTEINADGSVKLNVNQKDLKKGLKTAKKFEYASAAGDSDEESPVASAISTGATAPSVTMTSSHSSSYSSSSSSSSSFSSSSGVHTTTSSSTVSASFSSSPNSYNTSSSMHLANESSEPFATAPVYEIALNTNTEPSAPPSGPKPFIQMRDISIDILDSFPTAGTKNKQIIYYYNMEVTVKGHMLDPAGAVMGEPVVRKWTVPKRFSEFVELHEHLSKYSTGLPPSPDKAIFYNTSMDALVNKRRVELKDIMCKLLDIPFVLTTSYFMDFIRVNDYAVVDRSRFPRLLQHVDHASSEFGLNGCLYDALTGILITSSENVKLVSKLSTQYSALKMLWSGPKGINTEGNTAPAPNTAGMFNCYVYNHSSQAWTCIYKRHFDANVSALAWNLNERRVFVGFQNGQVCTYQASPNFDEFSCIRESHPHKARVDSLVYIAEKDQLVSTSRDSSIVIQRASSTAFELVAEVKVKEGRLCSARYDAANDYLYVGAGTAKLLVYDMSKAQPQLVHMLSGHEDVVRALYFCTQTGYLVTGSFDRNCGIWQTVAPTGAAGLSGVTRRTQNIGWLKHGTASKLKSVAICAEVNMIASGADNGVIELWDTQTGLISYVLHDHTSSVVDLHWVGSSNMLISAARDGKVHFYTIHPTAQ